MRHATHMLILLCAMISAPGSLLAGSAPQQSASPIAPDVRQLIRVVTADWNATEAQLAFFVRDSARTPWVHLIGPYPAVVGRSGLGWGVGAHGGALGESPCKREGDGRAPAGVFQLGPAFGYASRDTLPWLNLPYVQATATVQCVDDGSSPMYNRMVDTHGTPGTWNCHEDMLRADDLYRLGLVVHHNDNPPTPGGGSCIFMHIWRGPASPTSGCTAMDGEHLRRLLGYLDADLRPVLVQLPAAEYARLRDLWGLP